MSWFLFDERGERAQRLLWVQSGGFALRGWGAKGIAPGANAIDVWGFLPERSWRPTYFVAKMAKGYRVFELAVGEVQYADQKHIIDWWQPASPDHRRFPTLAAVEMFLRMKA